MLKIIGWYLFIGVIFNFLVDMSTDYAKSKGVKIPDQTDWNWSMRIVSAIIWPIGMISFLNGFIKEYTKKHNNKNN